MTNRRKFLAGVGALASGSAAAVGTGAFTSASAERDANINVVADSNGLMELSSVTSGDLVREENGELLIDFTSGQDASGVNLNSEYEVGDPNFGSGNVSNPAFLLQNNSDNDVDLTITYTVDSLSDIQTNGSFLTIHAEDREDNEYIQNSLPGNATYNLNDSGYSPKGGIVVTKDNLDSNGQVSGSVPTISPGDAVRFAIYVNTTRPNASTSESLTGGLELRTDQV